MLLAFRIKLSPQLEAVFDDPPNHEPLELPIEGSHEELLLELIEGNHDELEEGHQFDDE